jgi:hypothetical protein
MAGEGELGQSMVRRRAELACTAWALRGRGSEGTCSSGHAVRRWCKWPWCSLQWGEGRGGEGVLAAYANGGAPGQSGSAVCGAGKASGFSVLGEKGEGVVNLASRLCSARVRGGDGGGIREIERRGRTAGCQGTMRRHPRLRRGEKQIAFVPVGERRRWSRRVRRARERVG